MPDETTAALQEIAALLRRRNDMMEESVTRSAEHFKDIKARRENLPNTLHTFEMRQEMHERLQEEERHFKQRLIAELERHNSLLERLLSRLP